MTHTLNFLDWLHQQKPYDAVWGHYLFPVGFLARGNASYLTLFISGEYILT